MRAAYADTLGRLKEKELIACSWVVYNKHIRGSDSSSAFSELHRMEEIAAERAYPALKSYAIFFKGKYCYDRRLYRNNKPLLYFREALGQANCPDDLKTEVLYHTGIWYYFSDHNFPLAFEHMLKANGMMEETGFAQFPDADELLCNLSIAYYQFGEYDKAIKYLHEAVLCPVSRDNYRIEIFNTLGLVYRDKEQHDSAIVYFRKALNTAAALQNKAWVGIATGNLGSIYYKLGQYDEALSFLYKDFNMSSANNQQRSAAIAALLIAQIHLERKNIDSASRMLQEGKRLAFICNDPRVYILLYKTQAGFYRYKGEVAKALLYTDSLIRYKDSISKSNDASTLEKARNKIETETHLANIRLLESEKDRQILMRNGIIGIVLLIGFIGWQSLRKSRLRQAKDLEIFELEKKRSAEELQNANMLLDTYVESLKQKNQLLEQFAAEVEQLHNASNRTAVAEKEEILRRLQEATILTEADWLAFKKLFTKVHAAFFIVLNEKFPNLTQAEIRLLALSRLGLSVNEKANMLGISPDSVRRTYQRLNKKTGLTDAEIFEELTVS